jgi:hypothetical protein
MAISAPASDDSDLAVAAIHLTTHLQSLNALFDRDEEGRTAAIELAKAWGEADGASELRKQAAAAWVQDKQAAQQGQGNAKPAAKTEQPKHAAHGKKAVHHAKGKNAGWAGKLRAAFAATGAGAAAPGNDGSHAAYEQGKIDAHKQHAKRIHHVLTRTARDSFRNGMMSKADQDGELVKAFDEDKHPRGKGGKFTAADRAATHNYLAEEHSKAYDTAEAAASQHEPDSDVHTTLHGLMVHHALRSIQHVDLAEHFDAVHRGHARLDPERVKESEHLLGEIDADRDDHHLAMAEHHVALGDSKIGKHNDAAAAHFDEAGSHIDHVADVASHTPKAAKRKADAEPGVSYLHALGRGALQAIAVGAPLGAATRFAVAHEHYGAARNLGLAAATLPVAAYVHGVYSSYRNQSEGFEHPVRRAASATIGHIAGDAVIPLLGGALASNAMSQGKGGKYHRPAEKAALALQLRKADGNNPSASSHTLRHTLEAGALGGAATIASRVGRMAVYAESHARQAGQAYRQGDMATGDMHSMASRTYGHLAGAMLHSRSFLLHSAGKGALVGGGAYLAYRGAKALFGHHGKQPASA